MLRFRQNRPTLGSQFGLSAVGIVAHVIIDGQIDIPKLRERALVREPHTILAPAAIAETYWQLHQQDVTAWTLELDLRPAVEKF